MEQNYSTKFHPDRTVLVEKKDGSIEDFDINKVVIATEKSAYRALSKFTNEEKEFICKDIIENVNNLGVDKITVPMMHNLVEATLEKVKPIVAKSYRDYRNYKQDFVKMIDEVYVKAQSIMYIGDKENANSDSALVSTKRSLIFNQFNKELYQKFFMTTDEIQACRDGYIYVHDMSARRDTMNCFHRSTRFITDRGVRSFYDFTEGDQVYVISHTGAWRRATVHQYGHQKIQKVTLQRAKSSERYVYVTPDHRWILKDGSITTDLSVGDKLIRTPDITKFSWEQLTQEEKKLWCLGFGFADGSIVLDNKIPTMHIRLFGNKTKFANNFISAGYNATNPNCLKGGIEVRMTDVHSKDLPFMQLNKDNVLYFINGYLSADGNKGIYKSSSFRGVQVTGEMNNFIYDLLNITGYYVTNTTDLSNQVTNYGPRTKETISYGLYNDCGDRTWTVKNIESCYSNGRESVWCLDVEEDHSFLLEGGIPTGNCCLFDVEAVLNGGFEMGNVWYNEPNSLDTAFDVIGDITLSAASQQYGKL